MSFTRYEVIERDPRPPLAVRLAISWLTNALVLAIVAGLLADVTVKNFGTLLVAAAVFGVLNTLLKPLLRFITFPLAILTLGIAWFFVSMLMLDITDAIDRKVLVGAAPERDGEIAHRKQRRVFDAGGLIRHRKPCADRRRRAPPGR